MEGHLNFSIMNSLRPAKCTRYRAKIITLHVATIILCCLYTEMKDPTYKSPLKSCAKEKDDTCPRPMDDTKTG